jgi:hypothetical protein
MSEPKDPERLLADALRAQAVFAPHPERTMNPADPSTTGVPLLGADSETEGLPPAYGLLSGASPDSLAREHAALPTPLATDPPTVRTPSVQPTSTPLPIHWVLLLAVLLGLAAGSVVGLLTLL